MTKTLNGNMELGNMKHKTLGKRQDTRRKKHTLCVEMLEYRHEEMGPWGYWDIMQWKYWGISTCGHRAYGRLWGMWV